MVAMDTACALLARELDEPLRASAPSAAGWLLVEHPGPWGPTGLSDSGIDAAAVASLSAAMADLDVRVQLIRRSAGARPDRHTVFLVHAGPGPRWCERRELDGLEQLAEIDPAWLVAPTPPGYGQTHDEPIYLVCTHAKRDACCAVYGRPLVAALASAYGDAVWETTHTGGHRFAGNLVVLPDGLAYGRVEPNEAIPIVRAHRRGLVDLAHLRGRAGMSAFEQAAAWFVRDRLAVREIDGIDIASCEIDGRHARVGVTAAGRTVTVTLHAADTGTARLIGCDKTAPSDPGQITLVSLEETGA